MQLLSTTKSSGNRFSLQSLSLSQICWKQTWAAGERGRRASAGHV